MGSFSFPSVRPYRLLGLALAAATAIGCASASGEDEEADEPSEDALVEQARAAAAEGLPVLTEESPSGGSAFSFCSDPPRSAPLNLTNAAWLAMLAANEYAHLGYLAPQLLDLGFGTAADRMWVQCGRDLGQLRDYELRRESEMKALVSRGPAELVSYFRDSERVSRFGSCAADYLAKQYTGRGVDGAALPGATFRDYLMRETQEASHIQFLSARPYTFLEKFMGRGSAQAAVARHGQKPVIIIAFRGTEPPNRDDMQFRQVIDIITDLKAWRTDLRGHGFGEGWGSAHYGFVSSFASLDDVDAGRALTRRVKALTGGDPNVGIWITGHSLGGALATLMTARLLDLMDKGEAINVRGMYTFGAPMVGNDVFKTRLEESARRHGVVLARFRNDQDFVTRVPRIVDVLNYHHAGRVALLDKSGLALPAVEPGYASSITSPSGSDFDDHSVAGIVGPATARRTKTGYYARIAAALKGAPPELVACSRP